GPLAAGAPRHVHQAREHVRSPDLVLAVALGCNLLARPLSPAPGERAVHHLELGPKRPKKLSNSPSREGDGAAAMTRGGGAGALGRGRTGMVRIAVAINRRQVCAGSEPPVTLPVGELSSLPNHTPATRSAVYPINQASRESWVVPVLPAAGRGRAALPPVPWL